ncbi:hypothetical protein BDM02DRAFT_1220930 [Thelephora ganbajun]|uniref:Uncharacterized protein n=1 Tax=Thelephora ganbajun TaxID=370292 RepID=A0ACB6ZP45_THEGA|nr:hypothetical protein BDM02DRAFT_1220930 [Thelephora ganbajun]
MLSTEYPTNRLIRIHINRTGTACTTQLTSQIPHSHGIATRADPRLPYPSQYTRHRNDRPRSYNSAERTSVLTIYSDVRVTHSNSLDSVLILHPDCCIGRSAHHGRLNLSLANLPFISSATTVPLSPHLNMRSRVSPYSMLLPWLSIVHQGH